MEDEGDVLRQAEVVEEGFQIIHTAFEGVFILVIVRLVGEATADVVRGDTAIVVLQGGDEVAIVEGPRRVAMDHNHGVALAFVHVGVFEAVAVDVLVLEGELGMTHGRKLSQTTIVSYEIATQRGQGVD